jgi:hypothetical protein
MVAYKRIQLQAAKEFEFMPKALTASIFDKTLQMAPSFILRNQNRQLPSQPESTLVQKGGSQSTSKPTTSMAKGKALQTHFIQKEMTMVDYDLNLSSSRIDV